ncbi:hypothetical protein [Facilibium subflavum]|uniref:hypothetical protein n=1 Tax=Facilibium subflavum TaxID=2219058 RepID=UPI000E658084|nr:hypothetical protein [Facilibium subflavum]
MPKINRSQPIDIPNSREIPVPGADGYLGDGHFVGSLPSENQGVDWRLAQADPELYEEQINAFFHMEMYANNSDLAPEN